MIAPHTPSSILLVGDLWRLAVSFLIISLILFCGCEGLHCYSMRQRDPQWPDYVHIRPCKADLTQTLKSKVQSLWLLGLNGLGKISNCNIFDWYCNCDGFVIESHVSVHYTPFKTLNSLERPALPLCVLLLIHGALAFHSFYRCWYMFVVLPRGIF